MKGSQYRCFAYATKTNALFRSLAVASIGILGCQAFIVQRPSIAPAVTVTATTSATLLHMNFVSDFLGSFQKKMNTGGSYNLGIDYDTMPFPGPEVGAMAVAITRARKEASSTGTAIEILAAAAPSMSPSLPHLELATFAGGCFWGLELALQRCEGIDHTLVGYTQGLDSEIRPNYEQVAAGNTGHCEAVMVYFDSTQISYETILRTVFLDRIDVRTVDGQGKDFGRQYRTGIYFHTPAQEETARRLLQEEVARTNKPVATEVEPAKAFWPAEEYHHKFLEKGGRLGMPQSAEKGNTDEIRCYG